MKAPSTVTKAEINKDTKIIYGSAFLDCTDLSEIALPNGLKQVGAYAFAYCSAAANSLVIPDSVISIENNAFNCCYGLPQVTLGSGLKNIGESAFADCFFETVLIPASVENIGNSVFKNCNCLELINVDKNNKNYMSDDGVLYTKDGKTLHTYPKGKTGVSFTVPDGVETILSFAFACSKLESIILPDGLNTIGNSAFEDCSCLKSITFPEELKEIGDCAFNYCESLTEVTLPSGITTVNFSLFGGCTNLERVVLPDTVKTISGYTFTSCESLKYVTIPGSVTYIGSNAFDENTTACMVCEQGSDAYDYALENNMDLKFINTPYALGGQIKQTTPTGLRLGFSIEHFDKAPKSLKIMVKKSDGEYKTVDVTKYYNTEKTVFTVCITNIPDTAHDVWFTAKAVATFDDGTTYESTELSRTYNTVLQNIEMQ